jgi:hypothetical protein
MPLSCRRALGVALMHTTHVQDDISTLAFQDFYHGKTCIKAVSCISCHVLSCMFYKIQVLSGIMYVKTLSYASCYQTLGYSGMGYHKMSMYMIEYALRAAIRPEVKYRHVYPGF